MTIPSLLNEDNPDDWSNDSLLPTDDKPTDDISNSFIVSRTNGTSLRVVMGQQYIIPVMGQSGFVENGRDDDRISN